MGKIRRGRTGAEWDDPYRQADEGFGSSRGIDDERAKLNDE